VAEHREELVFGAICIFSCVLRVFQLPGVFTHFAGDFRQPFGFLAPP
jgi:hypothetical protein